MRLTRYVIRRLAFVIPQLFVITTLTFFLVRIIPGDPALVMVGPFATEENIAAMTVRLGLDKSLPEQYVLYLDQLIHGDLGYSFFASQPVLDEILRRLPATLELLTSSLLLAILVGVPLGIISAVQSGGLVDRLTLGYRLVAGAMPEFLAGLIFIYLFFHLIPLFPAPLGRISLDVTPPEYITGSYVVDSILTGNWMAFRSSVSHLLLPTIAFAFMLTGPVMKMTRASAHNVLTSDFILYARASGLHSSTIMRYTLRNALPPVVTLLGFFFGFMIGGAVLIEIVFSWGGLGQFAVQAIDNSDYAALQGFVLVSTLITIIVYLAVDIAYFVIDPRVQQ